MNSLQLTLIGIAGALVLAVWIFNRIQEWRWHRLARSTLGEGHADVLLGEPPVAVPGRGAGQAAADGRPAAEGSTSRRSEPAFGHPAEAGSAGGGATWAVLDESDDERAALGTDLAGADPLGDGLSRPATGRTGADAVASESLLAPTQASLEAAGLAAMTAAAAAAAAAAEAASAPVPLREDLLAPPDEEIEYLVPLACNVPVTGVELWRHLAKASAPVRGARWLGRRVTDGHWCVVRADSDQRFDSLRAALLLANRQGPVTSLDLERFCSLVSALATQMTWRVEFPPRAPALERAEALDEFCAAVDIVVGINVVLSGGQSVAAARVARWAESHGMTLEDDGAYHLVNAQGQTLWRLANRDPLPFRDAQLASMQVGGVTFLLDVPLVEQANQRLSPMFDAAATLARELGARVLDDNGAILGPQQLGRIARELAVLLERMAADGIPAGGIRARRLFAG